MARAGSTFLKYCVDSGWMTKANRLLRLSPLGRSSRGSSSADSDEVDEVVGGQLAALGVQGAATIASSIAVTTMKWKGCGVASMTRSTPRLPSSASRSSEIALVMTVLPARSSGRSASARSSADDDVGVAGRPVGELVAHPPTGPWAPWS
jgi:hypothetical protein